MTEITLFYGPLYELKTPNVSISLGITTVNRKQSFVNDDTFGLEFFIWGSSQRWEQLSYAQPMLTLHKT